LGEQILQIKDSKDRKNKALDTNQCRSRTEAVKAWIGLLYLERKSWKPEWLSNTKTSIKFTFTLLLLYITSKYDFHIAPYSSQQTDSETVHIPITLIIVLSCVGQPQHIYHWNFLFS